MPCSLCDEDGGLLLMRRPRWRLVRATDTAAHPAFYRLIWNAHVAEFSQLSPEERAELMEAVCAVERLMLDHLKPAKLNLASLGNVVPHLHWHLIARYEDDAQFPAPIWAPPQRETPAAVLEARRAALPTLDAALQRALSA